MGVSKNVPLLIWSQYHHFVSTPKKTFQRKINKYRYTSKSTIQSCQTHHMFTVTELSAAQGFFFFSI